MIRALRALRRRDAGLTLVELLIAIALTALIAMLATAMFVAGTHSVSLAQSIDGGTRQASNGMNEVARMIRAATPNPLASPTPGGAQNDPAIQGATTGSITFFAYVNLSGAESPVKVTFSRNGSGELIEQQFAATTTTAGVNGHWDFASAPTLTRTLCSEIPSDLTIFRYYDKSGAEILPPIASSSFPSIASVQVTITIRPTGAASAVTVTNTIGMANVGTGS